MAHETKIHGPEPTAEFLFDLLVRLLEDQEGVKITYELELESDTEENNPPK